MKNRLIFTILFSLAYALARYAWFSDVAAIHIPTYLVNKAIAVVAVFFVFYAALDHKQGRHDRSREWGRLAMQAAFVHVLLSLAILKPGYFETFFGGVLAASFSPSVSWTFQMDSSRRMAWLHAADISDQCGTDFRCSNCLFHQT